LMGWLLPPQGPSCWYGNRGSCVNSSVLSLGVKISSLPQFTPCYCYWLD
jgi:hypothetical protein